MMNVNIGGTWVTQASYQKARRMVASKQEGGRTYAPAFGTLACIGRDNHGQ